MKKILIPVILLSLLSFKLAAQNRDRFNFDNLYFFGQFGNIDDYNTFAQVGAFLQFEQHYFKISVAGGYDGQSEEQKRFHYSHKDCECRVETRGIDAVNFEYGKVLRFFRRQQLSLSSGFSIVTKTDPNEVFNQSKQPWEEERFIKKATVGLPYELRYSLMVNRGIGLGCSYYGNLNAKKSFNAVSFGVAFGLF